VDDDSNKTSTSRSFASDETAVPDDEFDYEHGEISHSQHRLAHMSPHPSRAGSPPPSPPIYNPPRHPHSIFSFPTTTSYSAPPNPAANLAPIAYGSASELFKCVVKKPNVVQIEINGEMQSNAYDVTTQFLAELRVYTTVTRHRNIAAFLGSLENVGMVLEYIDGRTLYEVIKARPPLTRAQKVDYHNQLLDGLTHLHSFNLSHGDLSLLNVQVTNSSDTIKLLDFGRSVCADSTFTSPSDEPVDPFSFMSHTTSGRINLPKIHAKIEQIHPGTRPFSAPEILRGECNDPLLADAYGFGIILVCLDQCASVDIKPWDQRKDLLPDGFFDGCDVFGDRCREYLQKWDLRRRLLKEDLLEEE
jgi:hypothetical protein